MMAQHLGSKALHVYSLRALHNGKFGYKPVLRDAGSRSTLYERANLATKMETTRPMQRRITPTQSMREFFMHPLTWDRNNGYLNILLGLAVFGFCFCTSCVSDRSKRPIEEKKKD